MSVSQRIGAAVILVVAIAAIVLVSTAGDTPGDGPETTSIAEPTNPTGETVTTSSGSESTGTTDPDEGNEGSSPRFPGRDPSDDGTRPAITGSTAPEDGSGRPTTKPPPPLTLEEFFGAPSGPDVVERSRLQAVERAIARCMEQRGFSYQPREIAIQPEDGPGLDVVRRIGFGISTSWSADGGGAQQLDSTVPSTTAPRRPQYYIALEGGYLGDGHEADNLGCRSHAVTLQNDRFRPAQEAWSVLEPDLAELEAAIDEDDRIGAAVEEWSGCMTEAGFAFDQPSQVFTEGVAEIQSRVDELTGGRIVNTNPFAGWSEEEIESFYRENSEEVVQRYIDEVTSITVPEVDGAELREIQDFEIALATANAECRRIIDRAEDSIRPDYEGAFIAEHRPLLEAIRSQVAVLTSE